VITSVWTGLSEPITFRFALPSAPTRYTDPRAHELRERYLATYGGNEIPVPVESIAEDLLGLRIESDDLGDCSTWATARGCCSPRSA
jgi:hypothetical protein